MIQNKLIRVGAMWGFLGEDYMTSGIMERFQEEKPTFTVIHDRNNELDKDTRMVIQ